MIYSFPPPSSKLSQNHPRLYYEQKEYRQLFFRQSFRPLLRRQFCACVHFHLLHLNAFVGRISGWNLKNMHTVLLSKKLDRYQVPSRRSELFLNSSHNWKVGSLVVATIILAVKFMFISHRGLLLVYCPVRWTKPEFAIPTKNKRAPFSRVLWMGLLCKLVVKSAVLRYVERLSRNVLWLRGEIYCHVENVCSHGVLTWVF